MCQFLYRNRRSSSSAHPLPYSSHTHWSSDFPQSSGQKDEVSLGVLTFHTTFATIQNHQKKEKGKQKNRKQPHMGYFFKFVSSPQFTCFCLLFRGLSCFFVLYLEIWRKEEREVRAIMGYSMLASTCSLLGFFVCVFDPFVILKTLMAAQEL